jgi:hypothetical protein
MALQFRTPQKQTTTAQRSDGRRGTDESAYQVRCCNSGDYGRVRADQLESADILADNVIARIITAELLNQIIACDLAGECKSV